MHPTCYNVELARDSAHHASTYPLVVKEMTNYFKISSLFGRDFPEFLDPLIHCDWWRGGREKRQFPARRAGIVSIPSSLVDAAPPRHDRPDFGSSQGVHRDKIEDY